MEQHIIPWTTTYIVASTRFSKRVLLESSLPLSLPPIIDSNILEACSSPHVEHLHNKLLVMDDKFHTNSLHEDVEVYQSFYFDLEHLWPLKQQAVYAL